MIKNFFRTAIRSLIRERYYAMIKIFGLAVGLGTSMVIFLYAAYHLSFDRDHPDVERLYRVDQTNIWDPAGGKFGSTGPVVSSVITESLPEVEEVMRVNTPGDMAVRYTRADGETITVEERVLAADSNFFNFFNFALQEGDPNTALKGNNKVVISDKAAVRIFGNESPLGKMIQLGDDRVAVEVTGVTIKQPENVHFQFDYLMSMPTNPGVKRFEWSWVWTQVVTYVKLRPDAGPVQVSEKLTRIAQERLPVSFQAMGLDFKEMMRDKAPWEFNLLPIKDIHLFSNRSWNRIGATGDITNIYIFLIVAAFVLTIAIINFVNLSTARATKRAKEVGVKKSLGLTRRSLVAQFQTEYMLVTFVAMLLGLGVMEILRMLIEPVAGIQIPLVSGNAWWLLGSLVLLPVAIGFLAGLYPSFYLTSFQPAQVLKGRTTSGQRNSGLRNILVVVQFTISVGLMASTLLVFQQLRFFQNAYLGFDKENVLIINNADELGTHSESFRNEIAQYEGVSSASLSMNIRSSYEDVYFKEGDQQQISISHIKVDPHFLQTMGLKMVAGKFFGDDNPAEYESVIINETTAKLFGWTPEQALGQRIVYPGDDGGSHEVMGVVNDFQFQSLRQQVAPRMFFHMKSRMWEIGRIIAIKFKTDDVNNLIEKMRARWNEMADPGLFEYSFLAEELNNQYDEERKLGSLFSISQGFP
ncbi:MAG: FtsX-like permease family protein [Bacteroidia bacterium]|nr:FtsX-like permease family protein [Bacteroidia bacterium]